jgi:hypothetical protein
MELATSGNDGAKPSFGYFAELKKNGAKTPH